MSHRHVQTKIMIKKFLLTQIDTSGISYRMCECLGRLLWLQHTLSLHLARGI